jgi:poly(A) polymerase
LHRARSIARGLYEQEARPRAQARIDAGAVVEPASGSRAALAVLRDATAGTPYEGILWIVGGYVRDKILGLHGDDDDIDIVTTANAVEAATMVAEQGVAEIAPVVYPRFGTAMIRIAGCNVELVTARNESYADDSRKPERIAPATLEEDALRRDFTINTLLENLHSGETRDPTGHAIADIEARILRTPREPNATFADDPLRMLRAVRFHGKLGFTISPHTWDSICANAIRLAPPKVSFERMRDEFAKTVMTAIPSRGLELLRRSGLLARFAPELVETVGVTQNEFHSLPVWDHTLLALDNLVSGQPDAPLLLRLAVLLHDIGKPRTRSVGADGRVHFYRHDEIGAEMARELMTRLKFSSADIAAVVQLVAQHMRIGEYKPAEWTDAAVRRLVRDTSAQLDDLFALHRADVSALAGDHQDTSRARALLARIHELESLQPSHGLDSPLTGDEIMQTLGLNPGPEVGQWKDWLLGLVLEGRLRPGDKENAKMLLLEASGQSSQ